MGRYYRRKKGFRNKRREREKYCTVIIRSGRFISVIILILITYCTLFKTSKFDNF